MSWICSISTTPRKMSTPSLPYRSSFRITQLLSESFQYDDVNQLCASKSRIPFNLNGPILALSFGSLFDASYFSSSPDSICSGSISISLLSFRFTLDELVSSDVARELQLLFSDTASLMQSNPTTLRKMKSHLEQFPSLASSQCVILSWFDSSSDFHFHFISEMPSCSKRVVWCPTGIP